MTLAEIKDAVTVLLAVGAFAFGLLLWRLKGEFAGKKEQGELEHRMERTEADVARLKTLVESIPDHEDLSDLKTKLAEVEGGVKVVATEISGLKEVLKRIEEPLRLLVEHHLKGGGR